MHQECECQTPLQCTCDEGLTYLLGDMDLFCLEKESINALEEWKKMPDHDPAGTMGMKPPEVGNK